MGIVFIDMAMSLDGFIGGLNDDDVGLYNWYFAAAGDPTNPSSAVIAELLETIGAMIMGRRTYHTGDEQAGSDNPYKMPHFVVTHTVPERSAQSDTAYTFVTDGIENALDHAKAAAGTKDVCIAGGANVAQQFINAGLVDEIRLHVVPLLLGAGIRLFDNLAKPVELERTLVIESRGVTHLRFRVRK